MAMRKIINGRTYNTVTSQRIGIWENTGDTRDFRRCCESLYKNTKGAYFIHGEGGPLSKYQVVSGTNGWSGGEHIIPLTEDEAREWAEIPARGSRETEIKHRRRSQWHGITVHMHAGTKDEQT